MTSRSRRLSVTLKLTATVATGLLTVVIFLWLVGHEREGIAA